MPVINLDLLLTDKMKAMHPKWKELKGKYAELIKGKKINFDKKLGPMLDKRVTLHKQISSFKKGGLALVVTSQLNAFKTNGKALQIAAASYKTKIKGMGNPAETEMGNFLSLVAKAAANDIVWADGKLTVMKTPPKK